MHRAIRSQVDSEQDFYSVETGTDLQHEIPVTRQEFRDDADVNVLLQRYGLDVPTQRMPQFGESDFDLDLHTAFIAKEQVGQAWRKLDPELRAQFKSPEVLLDAMNSGELEAALKEQKARKERATPPTVPAAVEAASNVTPAAPASE